MSQKDFLEAHKNADVDAERNSYHHTLGKGANQAAPGNHLHPELTAVKVDCFEIMLEPSNDIVGTEDVLSITIPALGVNDTWLIIFNVSYDIGGGSGTFDAKLVVDTDVRFGAITVIKNSNQTDQATRSWHANGLAVGNHTFKMRITESSGSVNIRAYDTTIQVIRYHNA